VNARVGGAEERVLHDRHVHRDGAVRNTFVGWPRSHCCHDRFHRSSRRI
jgi:hypothetical protein